MAGGFTSAAESTSERGTTRVRLSGRGEQERLQQQLRHSFAAKQTAEDASESPPSGKSVVPDQWLAMGVQSGSDSMAGVSDVAAGLQIEIPQLTNGMSTGLRNKVEAAIAELGALGVESEKDSPSHSLSGQGRHSQSVATRKTPTQRELKLEARVKQLEDKLSMSRSIMRKLYQTNVELEKDIKVRSTPSANLFDSCDKPSNINSASQLASSSSHSMDGVAAHSPIMSMIKERDQTIYHLKLALESSRMRAASLEENLASFKNQRKNQGPAEHRKGSVILKQDVVAQSTLHFKQYQQIRKNYNDLLNRRTRALSRAPGAAQEAKVVVSELQTRLTKEMEEREAEAAIYNARLYENEKRQGDWYVEKKLLEKRIREMDAELKERDKVDGEIESCVASLFERIEALEKENEHLRERV